MSDSTIGVPGTPKRIGLASDHGGHDLKQYLARRLEEVGYETFLAARFSGAERHRRRLSKVADLENKESWP